jgi:hypothetical protein
VKTLLQLLAVTCLSATAVFAQRDGVSPFSKAESHEIDTIDLLTLTPTRNISIISKKEMIPFSYAYTARQSCAISGSSGDTDISCGGLRC